MPTLVNLSGNISDLIGTDFDARRTKVWVTTNVPDSVLIDATGNTVRLGDSYATVATDGTFTFAGLWATNAATNPTAFQYQLHIDYPKRSEDKGRKTWSSGWFDLTATADLADVAQGQYVPPTWMTTAVATLQGYVDDAETARDAAVDISGIDIDDDIGEILVLNTGGAGPKTSAALSATYVGAAMLVGAGIDYTGATDSTAAVQAFINAQDAGAAIQMPPNGVLRLDGAITLTLGKSLVGQGYQVLRDGVETFGDSEYANSAWFGGTVIRSGVTSGPAILFGNSSPTRCHASGFILIGPGSGTSTGIQIGRNAATTLAPVGPSARDIMVCNFATGWRFEEMNEGVFTGIAARGCTTGFALGLNVNANAFVMLNAQRCGTGIDIDATCLGNSFQTPLCQNITTAGMVIRGRFHTIVSPYTEECATALSFVGAAQCVVQSPAMEGSGTPTIVLDAASNQNQILGLRTIAASKLLTNAGNGNVLIGQMSGVTDTGLNTMKIDTNDGRISGLLWSGRFEATAGIRPQRITGTLASTLTAAAAGAGSMIYSNSLGKPAWSDGTNWRDAAGTIVT